MGIPVYLSRNTARTHIRTPSKRKKGAGEGGKPQTLIYKNRFFSSNAFISTRAALKQKPADRDEKVKRPSLSLCTSYTGTQERKVSPTLFLYYTEEKRKTELHSLFSNVARAYIL